MCGQRSCWRRRTARAFRRSIAVPVPPLAGIAQRAAQCDHRRGNVCLDLFDVDVEAPRDALVVQFLEALQDEDLPREVRQLGDGGLGPCAASLDRKSVVVGKEWYGSVARGGAHNLKKKKEV